MELILPTWEKLYTARLAENGEAHNFQVEINVNGITPFSEIDAMTVERYALKHSSGVQSIVAVSKKTPVKPLA